jgi:signal transduction histidine kinase
MATSDISSRGARRAHFKSGLRTRSAMLAGFGALLALMVVICVDSLRTLGAFESANIEIRQDFLFRERTLDRVRAGLYESNILVGDYVLSEGSSATRQSLQTQLQSVQAETTAALTACIQSLPESKKQPFQHLAAQLENYWSTIGPVFALDSEEDSRGAKGIVSAALRKDLLAQDTDILAITKEVSAVNDEELRESDATIGDVFRRFRNRLLAVAAVASAAALVLAAATFVYVGRLEEQLEAKYEESLRAQYELKDLSKRLVDTEERERRALSRELHDEVGQSLSALLVDVENLAAISGGDGELRQGIEKIKALAENSVNEVRDMALLLRPSMLDDLGLVPALEWQAREVSKRTGMIVDVLDKNVADDLPEDHKTCVYRIVQEALNNCSKHAHAKQVQVSISQEAGSLRLGIEDDGKGFDPARTRGLGLVGMNERVTQLGGRLQVESSTAGGTHLRVELPLPVAAAVRRKGGGA